MEATMSQDKTLRDRIDAIEEGYEFLLAYAAQGRQTDQGSGQDVRTYLTRMDEAMEGLGEVCKKLAGQEDSAVFLDAVSNDAHIAQGLVRLILAQQDISSQLVDNLNANVHLRTLLTDMFIIDDVMGA
jgi:hypothetical protein